MHAIRGHLARPSAALLAALGLACVAPAVAAPEAQPRIFSCVTSDGRRLTADRPIPECNTREQRLHNQDGSVRRVIPPQMTPEERAEKEARDRKAELDRLAQLDAVRRDKNLVARYPDEATHHKAREAALDTVRLAMRASDSRTQALAAERKALSQEAEFYKNKTLPPKLKQQIDANDAATEAQRSAVHNQQAELERISRLYDAELARLKKLWAGAPPGTLAEVGAPQAGARPPRP